MKTKMKKMQDGGPKKTGSKLKANNRTQVSAKGKIRTTTTNEKGQRDYIHTGNAKDGNFTGKGDKYYTAGKMNAQIGKPGKVEYSQDNYSKDVDTTGYSAGKKQFTVNTNITKPGGKTSTTSKTISRSQVKPMLDRMKSTASKMKTGGMVNPNAKMQADKTAGSKGVKSGVNPKAAASKVAKGRSGGTSVAPKTALPKAQMGKIVKMASNAAKVAGKGAKKASGSVLDFRKAATKSDMSKAFSNVERAKLKKQLQDLDKAKKG